ESFMDGIDYVAIARTYGLNDEKKAKKLYSKALDITRMLVGDVPQNKLEADFPKELGDNYQDILQASRSKQWRESVDKNKENKPMKNKTKIREYLDNDMPLDELIDKYDMEESESYSQAMINPNTTGFKGKRKEYADADGDLAGDNGYGTSYAPDGENAYGTEDDKNVIVDADFIHDPNDDEAVE
ncbi:unnamed protein product, partial [marine sediment metagenome]